MSLPKILHTGDFHINALKKFRGYLSRMESTLDQIHTIGKKGGCDLIVVTGDVWNTRAITHEERQLFSDWLGASPLPTVIISGNHDRRGTASHDDVVGNTSLSYLSSLNSITKRHLVWDGTPTIRDFHECRFLLFPAQKWTDVELDLMLQAMVRKATESNRKGYPLVVVLHEPVVGAKTDTGFVPTSSGQVKLREGKFSQVSYWALGDIHLQQKVLSNAFYCGSPHQISFAEKKGKGVFVVDLNNPTEPKFKQIKSNPLLQLKELPDVIPKNAYIQYKPDRIEGGVDLPPNVIYHPDAKLFKRHSQSSGVGFGLLDKLDEFMTEAGLKKKRRKLSWTLVKDMCGKANFEMKIPKQYRKFVP